MKRFILLSLALLCLPTMVTAKDFTDKYVDVSMKDLTEFSEHHKAINLNAGSAFSEYLKVTDCTTYLNLHNNQFKQQERKQLLEAQKLKAKDPDKELYFRIPISFLISGYNFDTQSFNVVERTQLHRVNMLELVPRKVAVCDGGTSATLMAIPSIYVAKLNFPISLRRIPIQRTIAESITEKMDHSAGNTKWQILYGYIFVQIDAIQPEITTSSKFLRATVRGQVNAIDLYLDPERTIQIKRLNYGEAF